MRVPALLLLLLVSSLSLAFAGGPGQVGPAPAQYGPPLDPTLMAMKEAGVWYFLCEAPIYPQKIPPHYLTFGPPPPAYCCPPQVMAPVPLRPQRPVKCYPRQ
jgi:hypothetical protein